MNKKRTIYLADCQSFYASVEKAHRPQYRHKPLVVAGDPERRSGIILAACPIAKGYGIKTAETLGEALAKCPDVAVIKPRMQTYIDVSLQITQIYKQYTDLVEPFSIDEQFLDVTGSLHLYGGDPEGLAKQIQESVFLQTGIYTRFGISDTKILAKTACDNYAKKNASGIYALSRESLPETLWKLPIDKLYMAGSRMTKHFNYMGITTIGALAKTPLLDLARKMQLRFGKKSDVNAQMYWNIANGFDDSEVTPHTHEVAPKSVGHMMTLPRDYVTLDEVKSVLLTLTELVCQRCRGKGLMGKTISVSCRGADFDFPTGFSRQMKMDDTTNVTKHVFEAAMELFRRHWDGQPVRSVGVSLSQFSNDDQYQISMFGDREKLMKLEKATDALKRKYGDSIIAHAASLTESGQSRDRSAKIGGHYK